MPSDDIRPQPRHNARAAETPEPARLAHLHDVRGQFKPADGQPDVRGWEVKTANGHKLGTVVDLLVDVQAQRARYLEVEISKEALGTSDNRCHLFPIGMARLNDDTDDVYLPVSVAEIRALPVYDRNIVHRHDERLLRNRFAAEGATATRQAPQETHDEFYGGDLYDHERFWRGRRT
ncbi:MAG: PRC-barrel domain-containing protein [Gemmatimonadota bacterium]|nr:PRC-barrel domain-containing protein [Gemmatimonadota bacterium]